MTCFKALTLALVAGVTLTATPALAHPHHRRPVVVQRKVVVVHPHRHHPIRHSYARPLTRNGHVTFTFVW